LIRHLALLHTAASNVEIFEAARRNLGLHELTLSHHVRADLLRDAEAAGRLTAEIAARTRMQAMRLAAECDGVVLTCSTLGPAVDGTDIVRVDAALARRAVRNGGRVLVLCAVETTVAPTGALFRQAAEATGAEVEMRLVPGAWLAFKAGDTDGYWRLIAHHADAAFGEAADTVALAQASMAGAARLCRSGTVLTSPDAALLQAALCSYRPRQDGRPWLCPGPARA